MSPDTIDVTPAPTAMYASRALDAGVDGGDGDDPIGVPSMIWILPRLVLLPLSTTVAHTRSMRTSDGSDAATVSVMSLARHAMYPPLLAVGLLTANEPPETVTFIPDEALTFRPVPSTPVGAPAEVPEAGPSGYSRAVTPLLRRSSPPF